MRLVNPFTLNTSVPCTAFSIGQEEDYRLKESHSLRSQLRYRRPSLRFLLIAASARRASAAAYHARIATTVAERVHVTRAAVALPRYPGPSAPPLSRRAERSMEQQLTTTPPLPRTGHFRTGLKGKQVSEGINKGARGGREWMIRGGPRVWWALARGKLDPGGSRRSLWEERKQVSRGRGRNGEMANRERNWQAAAQSGEDECLV